MTRNLKALGLALVAVFAMTAFAASAAQATSPATLTAEQYPVTIDGFQEGEPTVFTRGARQVRCEVADLHAEVASAAAGQTITAFPTYENCKANLELPATVTMNSCHFVFHLTADASDTFTSVSDLVCEVLNDKVEIHVYNNHTDHTNGTSQCTYTFGAQSGKTTIDLTNEGPVIHDEGEPTEEVTTPKDWITADINVGGIVSTRPNETSHGHGGLLSCGPVNHTTGTLVGEAVLKGTDAGGNDNGITVSTAP